MTDAVDERFAQLRAKFAADLPVHRENVLRFHRVDDRRSLIDLAHKLAGIAGMMGAPEVGEAAFQLEEALRKGDRGEAEFLALIRAIDCELG